jgi:plasmid maintenance system antidote protein VapI
MVNIEDFIKRLEIILDYYSLNASSFADKIGVQRSSLSHLLSGRNKPSLDFILKIVDVFPDVDLYWILIGKGNFPKNTQHSDEKENKLEQVVKQNSPTPSNMEIIPDNFLHRML